MELSHDGGVVFGTPCHHRMGLQRPTKRSNHPLRLHRFHLSAIVWSGLATSALVLLIEGLRQQGIILPIPFLLILTSVVLSGSFGGVQAGISSAAVWSVYILYAAKISFGPPMLIGGTLQILMAIGLAFGLAFIQGRYRDRTRRLTQDLQAIRDSLDRQVEQRTQELVLTNAILKREIEDRKRAERERLQAEKSLQEQEELLRSIVQEVDVGLLLQDASAKIWLSNQTALDLLGLTEDQLLGRTSYDPAWNVIHEDGSLFPGSTHPVPQAIATRQAVHHVVMGVYRPATSDRVWLLVSAVPQFDEEGNLRFVVCSFIDITKQKQVEQALQDREEFLRSVYEGSEEAIFVIDVGEDGEFYYAGTNPVYTRFTGIASDGIEGKTPEQAYSPENAKAARLRYQECVDVGQMIAYEEFMGFQGQDHWWFTRLTPLRDRQFRIYRIIGASTNITELKQAEQALQQSEAWFRLLAENMQDLVCLHSPDGDFLYVSPSCKSVIGMSPEALLGVDPFTLIHPDDRDRVYQEGYLSALEGSLVSMTYRMRKANGEYVWLETLAKPILDEAGNVIQFQTASRDVTERILSQEQLKHDARHDSLTGLANRNLLMERLEFELKRATRYPHYTFAVLFLDLDRFKVINDSLGHLAGDELLVMIARKLEALIRPVDLAARLGGDEFVLVLEDVEGVQNVLRVAERVVDGLQIPYILEAREVFTSASVGIVLGTNAYPVASDLLRDADIAMYRAKANGKARYAIFDPEMHQWAIQQLQMENDLRQALKDQALVLHYQPIVSLKTGALTGFEALVRWQHPQKGLILPAKFIPTAEEIGLIHSLGVWAMGEACQQLSAWQQEFDIARSLHISVNLSAKQLREPDFIEQIDRILAETGLEGNRLVLEITESVLIDNAEEITTLMLQLRERSIQLCIDDFGTGYSSLSYLHRLPVNALKVDRSFVSRMGDQGENKEIVETIVTLAEQLGCTAVAEGVETLQQLHQLRAFGCELGQGFLFAKPLPAEGIQPILAADHL
jgi:diguanylate cyclase (GGDEF)-like protein/PAS domain S-box-containing protein